MFRGRFDPKACGILIPWPGIEPTTPALEGEFSTTGPPGKSLYSPFEPQLFHLAYHPQAPSMLGAVVRISFLSKVE